jgi:hypothetical protein
LEDELGPLRIFAIAFRYRLKDVAMLAMRHTRNLPVLGRPYLRELDYVSARVHHQLIDYHWRCSTAAMTLDAHFEWLPKPYMIPECSHCSTRHVSGRRSPQYWSKYMENAKAALKERPCGASVLSSHLIDGAYANSCMNCYKGSVANMRRFSTEFAKAIERITSRVSHYRL